MNNRAASFALVSFVLLACGKSAPPPATPAEVPIAAATTPTAAATTAPPDPGSPPATTATESSAPPAEDTLEGKAMPKLDGKSMNGKQTPVAASLQGKVVILHFWATWCVPCKKSMPALEALETKYKKRGLVVIGVAEDDDSSGVLAFGKTTGATFPLVWDDGKQIIGNWKAKSMPATYVIDRKGVVHGVHNGYHDDDAKVLEEEVKKLF